MEVTPVKWPVARALCFDDIDEPVAEAFEFTTVSKVTLKRGRKPKASRVLVDSEVRRSARLSAMRDGYRQEITGTTARKPHKMKKRKSAPSKPDDETAVPPLTTIVDLQ